MTLRSILVVEDDVVDAMSIQRAFKEVRCPRSINIVANGKEALQFLDDKNNEKPGIIILDLNLPIMNGVEFLRTIKQDHVLKRIPVVVFTSSKEQPDKLATYNLSIAGYMAKPAEHNRFIEKIRAIHTYWALNELPD